MRGTDARGFVLVQGLRVMGARLHVHWSVLAASVALLAPFIRQPALALEAVGGYLGVLLLHEIGHAAVARRLGCPATDIRLSLVHGRCDHDAPDTLRDDALIAWGGVLAQLAVAVPLIALAGVAAPAAGLPIAAFGYASLLAAAVNLVPVAPLDGARAWRLVPVLRAERRVRAAAEKATRDLMQRLR
jgi:Zn-dependent protease